MKKISIIISITMLVLTACNAQKMEKMENTELRKFATDYIETWSTVDAKERKRLIDKVYSTTADFYANEPDSEAVHHHGLEKIYENITQVNERLVVGNKLKTVLTGYSENHSTLKVTWAMKTPDGNTAMKGMNFLALDDKGKILKDYIFLN